MTHQLLTLFLLLSLLANLNANAKSSNYIYRNAVFSDVIKSVQMFREGNVLSNPVYELGSDARLLFKFDDLAEEVKNYSYTVIHCDANWNESYIQQNEYLSGFPDNPVSDYAPSINTTIKYINYQLVIPNQDCNPKYSGNYALVVFENNDREKVVLIQRFYVVEPKVSIEGIVKKSTFETYNGEDQEVDFKIINDQLRLSNPREDIKVVLMQNRRWDNAITNLKPVYIRDNALDYNYDKENVFHGGNEFRYFDIRTTRLNGENVEKVNFIRPYYHVTLLADEIRGNKKFMPYKEMNGNFTIESQDRIIKDADTECDYMFVHFYLKTPAILLGGTVNVFGAFTGWTANKSNEMTWDFKESAYHLSMLLKQGYYNFQYIYVPDGAKQYDSVNLEGSFYLTENEYQIFAYYRDISSRYDRLVGYITLNSNVK